MCGICGIFSFNNNYIDSSVLNRMCKTLYHRGPDNQGIHIDGSAGIAMRRLSIIDLSTGHQPIHNEDKSIWIVFNGEIYNFVDLKEVLEREGHRFYTKTDTEVIVHLYEDYGEKCLELLRGMFAFAIWDKKSQRLFLARDRMGIKPLYYTFGGNYFIFGSELKSLLVFPGIKKEIDFTSLWDFFTFLYVPCPRTIYKNIYKLPPAHYIDISNSKVSIRKYWTLGFKEEKVCKEEEYIERTLNLLEEAIKLEMISDVPVGAFLSGGIDSSIVVALMSRISSRAVETFTIGYDEGTRHFDERMYARKVAEKYNTNHHEFILRSEDIEDLLDKVITSFDEPFADASAIPNYLISRETRNYVKVALSGLGGDELCAGYERYFGTLIAEKYRKLPTILTKRLFPYMTQSLPDSQDGSHFNERLKRFVKNALYEPEVRYFNVVAKFNEDEKNRLFNPDIQKLIERPSSELGFSYFRSQNGLHLINKMINTDFNTYLHDDLLTLTDRMSMANSLEVRVPFLDYKLVEYFATIPPNLKLKGINKKYLLKKVAERLLPHEIIYRRKKGFSVPSVIWFRKGLRKFLTDVLSEKTIQSIGFLNYHFINEIFQEHFNNRADHDEKIWALVNFVLWYKNVDKAFF